METPSRDSESLLACLAPILTKPAARELDLIQEVHSLFPGRSTPDVLKQIRALGELLTQFPELTLAEIAKIVRTHIESQRNSPTAVVARIRDSMQNASGESVAEIEKSLRKMTTTDLKKLGKSLDLELAGSKAALVESVMVWINSGGTIRPKTKAELAAENVRHYIAEAKPLMRNVDSATADRLLAIIKDVAGNRALGKDGLEALLKELNIPVSGSKAQMRKQAEEFIKRLSVTWVQTHS